MSQQHLNGFLADIRSINPGINIDNRVGRRTSLEGLITHLRATVAAPISMTVLTARQHCADPADLRLAKYMPALERLVSVWGRGNHRVYPATLNFVAVPEHLNHRAQQNFALYANNAPVNLRPQYAQLDDHDDDPFSFANGLGPGYLLRVPGAPPLDITARGLLLKAGLAPPPPEGWDNGYVACLQLTANDLTRMQGRSILDVGCGAAIFRAEMEALYGCDTTGIDLNFNHVPAAIPNGQSRYVRSCFYLKMLSDKGVLSRTTVPPWTAGLLDRQITELQNILNAYAQSLPVNGDVFNLAAVRRTWEFTFSMFLLCYFDADQQTEAVLNMCSVTKRSVFLYAGRGLVISPRLIYDQDQVRAGFPGCNIVVKDERTHHIHLR